MKALLFVILMSVAVWAQGTVKTFQQPHDWVRVFNDTLGRNGNADTTSAFSIKNWYGVATMVVETDTGTADVSGTSDSCMTIWLQLYRLYNIAAEERTEGDWMTYYNSTDEQKFKIDTVARAIVNDSSKTFYINLAAKADSVWSWADSARFIIGIGVGDTLESVKIDVGGM